MYKRNRIYISHTDQQKIKDYKIFLAGAGIGSVIAECALRIGFTNITIADGDTVELSNLNRQNYAQEDVGKRKTDSIKKRLLSINCNANIITHDYYLTSENIEPLLDGYDVAINALDFQTDAPFVFDDICQQKNIPVLHPYNIGWAGLIFVIMPDGLNLRNIAHTQVGFEKSIVSFFLENLDSNTESWKWISKVLSEYENEEPKLPPPQLSVASWLLGGSCANIMFNHATKAKVKEFPQYYFITND